MTFNANIPNAGQSPELFPNQSHANFTRLKTLINADHVFNDSAQANDGSHRQVTLTNLLANPSSLPATTNAIVFSKNDTTSGVTQLYFYNGTTTQQISGYDYILPMRVVGSALVNAGMTTDVLNVAYNFSGSGHAWFVSGGTFRYTFAEFIRVGTFHDAQEVADDGGSSSPEFGFTGNVLQVRNNAANTQTIFWSCVINRNS